jgi:hypothetical protein
LCERFASPNEGAALVPLGLSYVKRVANEQYRLLEGIAEQLSELLVGTEEYDFYRYSSNFDVVSTVRSFSSIELAVDMKLLLLPAIENCSIVQTDRRLEVNIQGRNLDCMLTRLSSDGAQQSDALKNTPCALLTDFPAFPARGDVPARVFVLQGLMNKCELRVTGVSCSNVETVIEVVNDFGVSPAFPVDLRTAVKKAEEISANELLHSGVDLKFLLQAYLRGLLGVFQDLRSQQQAPDGPQLFQIIKENKLLRCLTELEEIILQSSEIQDIITRCCSGSPGEIMDKANLYRHTIKDIIKKLLTMVSKAHTVDESRGYTAIRKSAAAAGAILPCSVVIAK